MKANRRLWISITLFATAIFAAVSLDAQTSKPSTTAKASVTATVEAIDHTTRTLMLKGPKGNVVELTVDPAYKRFDQLKVGDTITASYYESVVANIRRPGDPVPKAAEASITPREGGPGGTATVQETVTVVIQSVDKANRAVTVKKQDGGLVSLRVENPKYMEMAKVGETVDITYTRALLIEANPAKP
jgi:hypothetical protein